MKKILLLALLSIFAATSALASTYTNIQGYGDGLLSPSSNGAYASTSTDNVSNVSVTAGVEVGYEYMGNSSRVYDVNTSYHSSVGVGVTIPSGSVPTYARGAHSVQTTGGYYFGDTWYDY